MSATWTRRLRSALKLTDAPVAARRRSASLRRRPLVELMEGRQLLSTLTVTTTADNGSNTGPTPGSLRWAVVQANAQPAGTLTTIDIKVGSGPVVFRPPVGLPAINRPIFIDGTTQPGYAGKPIVDIDGTNAGLGAEALTIEPTASGTATTPGGVKGLEITHFSGGGIGDEASYWNFSNDYVGLTVVGSVITDEGNSGFGLEFFNGAGHDQVTGSTISANNGPGVLFSDVANDTLSGDFLGTDPAGKFAVDTYGNALGNTTSGVLIAGGSRYDTVANSVISDNAQQGIYITDLGTSYNTLTGDLIGTDATGSFALPNHAHGVLVSNSASYNTIGGTAGASTRDVISGNADNGVAFSAGDNHNLVEGDYLGTDKTGTFAVPNGAQGVFFSGSSADTVGGTTAAARDLVSGNAGYGVWVTGGSTGVVVEGDYVGTDVTGTKSLPNLMGVVVDAGSNHNTIGGTTAGARDVVSGNSELGVYITGTNTAYNVVEGDYLGTDYTGTVAVPNGWNGLDFTSGAVNNTAGGTAAGARNVISGNAYNGVVIAYPGASSNVVEGNFIGTDYTGTKALANGADGVEIIGGATGNTIGGTAAGSLNVISGNAGHGVLITDSGTSGNVVAGDYLGTDVTGKLAVPNYYGLTFTNGATGNTAGGATAAARDVISGNRWDGVQFLGSGTTGNVLAGSYVGLNVAGLPLGNGGSGVALAQGASGNTVGGSSSADLDVISGNVYNGVYISDAGTNNNTVQADIIGLDPTGELARGNGTNGVIVQAGAQGNNIVGDYITANVQDGVLVDGSSTTATSVNYDWIGLDVTGTKTIHQNGQNYSNYWGVLFTDGANYDSASSDVISGNYIGVQLGGGATGDFINNDKIGTDIYGTGNLGNVVDGIDLVGVVNNDIENDLIVYNGNVGIQGLNGSNTQNNSVVNDTFYVTVNGVTYGNKNAPMDFD